MSIQEAETACKNGLKITHKYWLPSECVYLENGVLVDENKNRMSSFFWEGRKCGQWNDGWSVWFKKVNPLINL